MEEKYIRIQMTVKEAYSLLSLIRSRGGLSIYENLVLEIETALDDASLEDEEEKE